MNKIHVISPAPKDSRRRGPVIDQCNWNDEFFGRAEEKDSNGFPTKGSFGLSFALKEDLSKVPEENLMERAISAIQSRARERGITRTLKQIRADAKQMIAAFKALKEGDIIALKEGTLVIAIVKLTSDYTFCGEQKWGWHSWSYLTLKKVSRAEQPSNYRGLLKTFMPNYLAIPDGLLESKTSNPDGAWAWA